MTNSASRPRPPRHYLSYVREDLIGSWKVQAVIGDPALGRSSVDVDPGWARKAIQKREALRGGRASHVWPWAFQLGRTPTARSLKKGDVLWIVTRATGLGRKWPPALVARMQLAEDACLDAVGCKSRKSLPFPYHFGVAVFTTPDESHFLPANDATRALLETVFTTPLEHSVELKRLSRTREAHVAAWADASRTGFQSLRRIEDPTQMEALVDHLATHSVFVSYRWADHRIGGTEYRNLCSMTEEMLIRSRIGVWLDRLTLPKSKHDEEQRRLVIDKLLATPLRETPVMLARVTENYGGLSEKDDDCSPSKRRRVRYTLLEWKHACRIAAWNRAACDNAHRLTGTPAMEIPRSEGNPKVARELVEFLSRLATE